VRTKPRIGNQEKIRAHLVEDASGSKLAEGNKKELEGKTHASVDSE
jgi:hypothetical protein